MALTPKAVQIGDRSYRVTPFLGQDGYRLLTALSRRFAAPLARAVGALGPETELDGGLLEMVQGTDFDRLGASIESLFARLDEAEAWSLTQRMLAGVSVRGGSGDWVPVMQVFDAEFAGNYGAVFKLLAAVWEVNYRIPLPGWLASPGEGGEIKG